LAFVVEREKQLNPLDRKSVSPARLLHLLLLFSSHDEKRLTEFTRGGKVELARQHDIMFARVSGLVEYLLERVSRHAMN